MNRAGTSQRADFLRITVWDASSALISLAIDKDAFAIGRSRDCDLVLFDPHVSRMHLVIRRAKAGWMIEDLGGRHGTFLDGEWLRGAAPLGSGARIRLGRLELRFEVVPARVALPLVPADRANAEGAVLVGESAAMKAVRGTLATVARSSTSVLIVGESGTGKEIAARLLHRLSPRAHGPFVVVNCPALPGALLEAELFGIEPRIATGVGARMGRIEKAEGGTLFLDEVGDLDLAAQAKLLRFLQQKQIERVGGRKPFSVDARVVAATHHDLPASVAAGRFRLDLYFRLNAITVVMPPLREHREDIPLLVEHFLSVGGAGHRRVSPAALEQLSRHDFPGNVRELEAQVVRAALLTDGPWIGPEAFSSMPTAPHPAAVAAVDANRSEGPQSLARRIAEGETFWRVVHAPFLRRMLPPSVVRELVEITFTEAGDSYRRMAARFGITDFKEYKKLSDFLRHHDLRPTRTPID